MEKEKLKALLDDMSLKEKADQMLQLMGAFYQEDMEGILTGPARDMGVGEEDIQLAGSILGTYGAGKLKKLQKEYPSVRIVLIKNYLSEKVGDIYQQKEYENIKEIREINRILEGYYRYFENQLAEVKAVEASECSYYFTDHQYEYGAIPSHLNELANQEIARMIERSIEA